MVLENLAKKSRVMQLGGYALFLGALISACGDICRADNPLITDQFTADPTARVFDGKIFLFPSHDIPAPEDYPRKDWFCMADYHTFSSENLLDWTDHGVIVSQKTVEWVNPTSYSMWAPDCVFKNGKYYFYFPANSRIGVAIADNPSGPYKPEAKPIQGLGGIDPCVLLDDDGSAYIYTSMNIISVAKLKDNMIELDPAVPAQRLTLPKKGLIEGPFAFKRNGLYYITYPHVENKTERLEYAIGKSPMGPFEHKGVIMDESASGCWTNHHSLVEYKGQWMLFYHDNDMSPKFDKNRSARADYLTFNEDGTIQKVIPTLRGVGIADARREIQIDRYSSISPEGTSVTFNDAANTHGGWKTVLNAANAWIQYNNVSFDGEKISKVSVKALSANGGTVEVRLDKADGPLLASVSIPKNEQWATVNAQVKESVTGKHDLIVIQKDAGPVEIDWVKFE